MRIILWLILLLIAQSLQSVTATDCVIAPFQQQSKLNATHYGSFKAGLFSYLSLDNRVRYCKRFGLACIIVSAEQAVETSAELAKQAPRVSKLQHILAVLDEPKDCSRLVYLDSDIVITTSSQNIFNSDFFRAAAAGQPIALTHDLVWTNATDVAAQRSSRYQTGVMLMQRSPLLVELLQAWLGQRKTERFDGSLARLRATGSSDKQQPTAQVSDSDPWDSDQWLLDRLLKAQPAYAAAISPLQPRHVYNAFPVHRALQHANATTLHQSRREKEGVAAALWQQMRRPQGDEVPGESLLVHFAGAFGGANPETGAQDALSTLLAVRGYLARHLHVVEQQLEQAPSQAPSQGQQGQQAARDLLAGNATHSRGVAGAGASGDVCDTLVAKTDESVARLLRRFLKSADRCIGASFSAQTYVTNEEQAEGNATLCLTEIARSSRRLVGNARRLETALRRARAQQKVAISCQF